MLFPGKLTTLLVLPISVIPGQTVRS